jgi:hypothetical protein
MVHSLSIYGQRLDSGSYFFTLSGAPLNFEVKVLSLLELAKVKPH